MEHFEHILFPGGFIPHGIRYLWQHVSLALLDMHVLYINFQWDTI